MALTIKKASRAGIKPFIVLYSESGCGKTFSALLLARGLAGPDGKIIVADSESGRASLYADVIPGGYDVIDLVQPFTPASYVEALDAIENAGADVAVVDSASHEWEGVGGVLDMAAEIEEKSGKPGLHIWKKPKFEHSKFVQRLMRSKIPVIVCCRAKYKSRQGKEGGKTVIIKDDKTSPIQAEDFIFEATCHAEILQNHTIILTKCSHPDLRKCFPEDQKGMISIEHGKQLAAWCNSVGQPASGTSTAKPKADANDPMKKAKAELWHLFKSVNLLPDGTAPKDWSVINGLLFRFELLDGANPEHRVELLSLQGLNALISMVQKRPEITTLAKL